MNAGTATPDAPNALKAAPLPPAQRTLPQMLARQAERFGERPLLTLDGAQWAHADAARIAARRGGALQAAGLARGERVALMCGNRGELRETFLGAGWIGAITVPINTAAMGPQIGYFLADSGARLLVIEAEFLPRLAHAGLARSKLQAIWVIGEPPGTSDATDTADAASPADAAKPTDAAHPVDAGAQSFDGIPCRPWPRPAEPAEPAAVQPGDTLAILYTSGTTGPSKGVLCPHAQYHWWGVHSIDALDLASDDVLCTSLPLFHINALNTFAQASLAGCRVVYVPRFSASAFWPTMRRHGATVVYLLGAMVPILLAQAESAAEREHRVRIGLGPGVPASAGAAFRARTGVTLIEGYGSTETNFAIATRPDSPRLGVMGWVRPGFEARVVDEQDVELPAGEAGELVLRASEPFVFASGYFGMPEKTVEAWRNLWFHTGDRVVRETDGAFRFADRIKDAIRRRGENISSWEVEQVLLAHPQVAAVAVYPVRSELAEDEVMAALIPKDGAAPSPAELAAFCEPRLPYYAVPRYIDIVADLPRTENGKVQKYKLRERGVTTTAWDRGPGKRPAKP